MSIPRPTPVDRGMAASADGVRVAWKRYGDGGPAVLFVPTWNLVDSRVVGHQVAALEPHATVITYDPRGAGESERPATGYGFTQHAADALAVLDATGIERAAIVTASRGLNAAVLLQAEHAERVDRIAVIAPYMVLDPNPPPINHERLALLRNDWAGFIGPFMRKVFTEPGSDELIDEMTRIGMESSPDVVATQETELEWTNPARLLRQVGCPTLVIHGEADAAVPVALAEAVVAAMPNAHLEIIPGGGHRPDIRSPELVNPLLLDFLLA